jgi:hypothetical protein
LSEMDVSTLDVGLFGCTVLDMLFRAADVDNDVSMFHTSLDIGRVFRASGRVVK